MMRIAYGISHECMICIALSNVQCTTTLTNACKHRTENRPYLDGEREL